jgi:hypothetical protein
MLIQIFRLFRKPGPHFKQIRMLTYTIVLKQNAHVETVNLCTISSLSLKQSGR